MTTETGPDASTDGAVVEQELVHRLAAAGWTLATAESLTGGGVGSRITTVPGASAVYLGGVIAYATGVKTALLGVSPGVVEQHGVVSAQCAVAMAAGVRSALGAHVGLSTTGVAGPEPLEGKPVGQVYVAVSGPQGSHVTPLNLTGDREAVRAAAVQAALDLAGSFIGRE